MDKLQQLEHTLQTLTSPRRAYTFWGLLLTLALCFGLLWLKHSQWLEKPNDYFLGGSPDGFKNYMTSLWHVRYDSSYVHYGGMNYPFGEHVLFTDNQPALSAGMQWWSRHVSSLNGKTAAVINVFQIISMLLGCGVLFLLFRKLHLPAWYAGVVSLGMVFLSPQYGRFEGHYGLSHTWIFPLLLLLLCRYEERQSRRYQSLQIGVLLWLAAQFHFYYFGLCTLFLGLYTGFQLLRDPAWSNLRRRFSHLVVMVLFPFVLLNIWLHWSDFAVDRPANPYGFTSYIGQWEGVLLPYENFPLFQWIDKNLVSIRRVNNETTAYAGLLAFLFTLWVTGLGIKWLLFKITRKKTFARYKFFPPSWKEMAYHRVQERYLLGIFAAVMILTIFSCGFPYAIDGFEWMVDYMGPLRQFRSMGRFTWAYFYIINLLAFYFFWNWSLRFKGFRGGRAKWFRWVLALVPALLLCWEAWTNQRLRPVHLMPNAEKLSLVASAPNHWLRRVDFSPYQALLPLPYYHMGSENIWWDVNFELFIKNQTAALLSGKPDMGVMMSRTSCGQTVLSAQMMLEPGVVPPVLNELPDNRPLAVLTLPGLWEEVKWRYPHLIGKATPVHEDADIKILSVSPDSIRTYIHAHTQAIENERLARLTHRKGPWTSAQPAGVLFSRSFDSLSTTARIFQGKGAYAGNMGDTTWLLNAPLPKGTYSFSFWMYANQDQGMNHDLKIFENSEADGHEVHFTHEGMRFHMKSIVDHWGLFEVNFEVRDDNSRVRAFLWKKNLDQPFFLDEVLIKPLNVDVYRREPGWVVRNNFWYNLDN